MAFDFPSNPQAGDVITFEDGSTYEFDGQVWLRKPDEEPPPPTP